MTETRKKPPKAVKAVGSVLAVLLVLAAGFTVVSHAVYHRSDMATLAEIYFRVLGTKKKFADTEECAKYIEQRRNAGEYALTAKLKSDVSEQMVNGNRVYVLSGSDEPDYLVLYLHGGAYISEASAAHWSFCDKLVQKANAEVVFPIYPLTPNHTWGEAFELITTVYQEILEAATVPVVIMGDSAGGGLAAAFCEYMSELGLAQPDKLILFSPWMDISMSNPGAASYEASDPMLSAYGLIEMGKCWAGNLDLHDYRVSPIFGDFSGLRNVYLFVGTREIFYPDVTTFYSMLQEQGIPSELYIGEGMNHVYPLYPIPEATGALEQICEILQRQM